MGRALRAALHALRGIVLLVDEAMRFAASVDADPRHVSWTGAASEVIVCIRPLRGEVDREIAERAA